VGLTWAQWTWSNWTEGTEPQVLEGMQDTLRRDRPVVFCEVLPARGTEEALEAVFDSLGYRNYLLRGDGPKLMDRIRADGTWLNWLFGPTERGVVPGADMPPAGPEAGKSVGRVGTEWRQRTA